MSTRSAIAIQHGDRIKAVYVHFDGYLTGVGYRLQHYWRDSVAVNGLIAGGDISSLGAEIGTEHPFGERTEYGEPQPGIHVPTVTTFYNRDRGDATTWRSVGSRGELVEEFGHLGCEYFYLFTGDHWLVRGRTGSWRRLDRALEAQIESRFAAA